MDGLCKTLIMGTLSAAILLGQAQAQVAEGLRPRLDDTAQDALTPAMDTGADSLGTDIGVPAASDPLSGSSSQTSLSAPLTASELRPALSPSGLPAMTAPLSGGLPPVAVGLPPIATGLEAADTSEKPKKKKVRENPYAPTGIEAGGFRIWPGLKVGGSWSDNAAQRDIDKTSDVGLRLHPSLAMRSEWTRHALDLEGQADVIYWSKSKIRDTRNADVRLRSGLDLHKGTRADSELAYRQDQQSPEFGGVPGNAAEDRVDHEITGTTSVTHEFGRFMGTVRSGARVKLYDDVKLIGGGHEKNSDRNYVEPEILLRGGYDPDAPVSPFVEVALRPRYHFHARDREGQRADSQGYATAIGADLHMGPIWTGSAALTYRLRDYRQRGRRTVDGLGMDGRVVWSPLEQTRVTISARSSTQDDETANEGGALRHDERLQFDQSLAENFDFTAGVSLFRDVRRKMRDDWKVEANAGLSYWLTPWFGLVGDYEYNWYDSAKRNSDYHENRISAGFEVRR